MFNVDKHAPKIMNMICCPLDEDNPDVTAENAVIHCSPFKIDGFETKVGDRFPLVAVVQNRCTNGMLFVNSEYIAGLRPGKKRLKVLTDSLLPWNEEAIAKYMLPDDWSIKNWVFIAPSGKKLPYTPGMEIDFETEEVIKDGYDPGVLEDEFYSSRGRINTYVSHALSVTEPTQMSIPRTKEEIEDMMWNMVVPAGLIDEACREKYNKPASSCSSAENKQALMLWLAERLRVPATVFANGFKLP